MKKFFNVLMIAVLGGLITLGGYFLIQKTSAKNRTSSQTTVTQLPTSFTGYSSGSFTQALPDFAVAADVSIHAVVHIKTEYERKNSFYDDFFGLGELFGIRPYVEKGPLRGAGSGVIIRTDGYIVTNNHVVQDATKIEVTLNDKRSYSATIVGTDPSTDLAVIKIEEVNLPYLSYGDSDALKIGEWVLAVGNPFNLTSTVTAGIVSAKARNINILGSEAGTAIESFIQTDAAVNRGNSGGALVNTRGELVGINAAIASGTGYYSGYSFAIPVNIVKKVVADLIEFNRVQRAYLGVKINDIDSKFAEQHNIKVLKGVYVAEVMDDGPAEEAGMKTGDIIVSIDETNVSSSSELLELIGRHRPGDHVRVGVNRKSEISYLTVELRNSDNTTQLISKDEISVTPKLGITVENASQDLLNKLNISHGVQITNIERNSVIAGAGVKKGFVILELDRKPVRRVEDIARILEGRRGAILMEGIYPNGVKAYYAFGL